MKHVAVDIFYADHELISMNPELSISVHQVIVQKTCVWAIVYQITEHSCMSLIWKPFLDADTFKMCPIQITAPSRGQVSVYVSMKVGTIYGSLWMCVLLYA